MLLLVLHVLALLLALLLMLLLLLQVAVVRSICDHPKGRALFESIPEPVSVGGDWLDLFPPVLASPQKGLLGRQEDGNSAGMSGAGPLDNGMAALLSPAAGS